MEPYEIVSAIKARKAIERSKKIDDTLRDLGITEENAKDHGVEFYESDGMEFMKVYKKTYLTVPVLTVYI